MLVRAVLLARRTEPRRRAHGDLPRPPGGGGSRAAERPRRDGAAEGGSCRDDPSLRRGARPALRPTRVPRARRRALRRPRSRGLPRAHRLAETHLPAARGRLDGAPALSREGRLSWRPVQARRSAIWPVVFSVLRRIASLISS